MTPWELVHQGTRIGVGLGSLVLLGVLGALAVQALRQAGRGPVGVMVALTLVAWGLRQAAPWGSHDLNLRNLGAWVAGWYIVAPYGHGLEGLTDPVVALAQVGGLGWSPLHLVTLTAVLSALHVPLLVGVARGLGTSWRASWLAGALLAVHPAAVRFARTDVQATPETLWTLAACVLWLRHRADGRPGWAWAAAISAGLVGHARPESLAMTAMLVGAMLLSAGERPVPWRPALAAVAVALPQFFLQLVRALTSAQAVDGLPLLPRDVPKPLPVHGPWHLLGFDPAWVGPLVGVALLLWPLARTPTAGWRWGTAVVALVASVLVEGDSSWTPSGGFAMGFARHQLRALPFFALLAAWGISAVADRLGSRWVGGALSVAVVASAATRLPLAYTPRTGQAEFRFFVDLEAHFAPGCQVYTPGLPFDAGLRPPGALFVGRGLRWTEHADPPDGACWLYYRSGECSLGFEPPLSRVCDAFEREHTLEVLEERWLVARPWIFDHHVVDPVRVGLYRVVR